MRISKLTGFMLAAFLAITSIRGNAEDHGERHEIKGAKLESVKSGDYRFVPDKIEIERGTTVEWINIGKKMHTVTDEYASWDSGNLKPGEKFSHRFDEKGTFKYYCVPHQEIGMTGTIIVK